MGSTHPDPGAAENTVNYAEDRRGSGDLVNGLRQWLSSGSVYGTTNLMTLLNFDLAAGGAGGPLYTGNTGATVTVRGIAAGEYNNTNFAVIINPERLALLNGWIAQDNTIGLTLSPSDATVGTCVNVGVKNAQPGSPIILRSIAPTGVQLTPLTLGTSDGAGSLVASYYPTEPAGTWQIWVEDNSGRRSSTALLTVRPRPVPPAEPMSLTLDQTGTGATGTVINCTPDSPVVFTATSNTTQLTQQTTASSTGQAGCAFQNLCVGRWTFVATDVNNRQSNAVHADVGGALTLSAVGGQGKLTLTAGNAVPNTKLIFEVSGGVPAAGADADASGHASVTFPNLPAGFYDGRVSDGLGRATQLNGIAVSPAYQPMTLTATVNGQLIDGTVSNVQVTGVRVFCRDLATNLDRYQDVLPDPSGLAAFSFPSPPGTYRLQAADMSTPNTGNSVDGTIAAPPPLVLSTAVSGQNVDASVTGARANQPVLFHLDVGATILHQSAPADPSGNAFTRFTDVPYGTWTIFAEDGYGRQSSLQTVTLQPPPPPPTPLALSATVYGQNLNASVTNAPPATQVTVTASLGPNVLTQQA
ncbi:MAG: hypothetical protein HY784_14065, partial [Chloroflexi bacterium]|nr:hypothetical protein [Chloroflexota bacterium]